MKGPAVRTAVQGWELSSIFSARSGRPLAISESGSQRPDLLDLRHAVLNTGLQYLNRAAFGLVPISNVSGATTRPGTLGNGVIEGPGYSNAVRAVAVWRSLRLDALRRRICHSEEYDGAVTWSLANSGLPAFLAIDPFTRRP